jgi:hypothetical protein
MERRARQPVAVGHGLKAVLGKFPIAGAVAIEIALRSSNENDAFSTKRPVIQWRLVLEGRFQATEGTQSQFTLPVATGSRRLE